MPTVMVIDDSDDFRLYLSALLERQGYEVLALANASDLSHLIKERPVDAVITDLYMPHVDGLEVVTFFAKYDPQLPVFGVTGAPDASDGACVRAMNTFGAREVFAKPIDALRLLAALAKAIKAQPEPDRQGSLDLGLPDIQPVPSAERH